MAVKRVERTKKQKLGQFMTPETLSTVIVAKINPDVEATMLEPSFGTGSFLFAYIDFLIQKQNPADVPQFVSALLSEKIFGVEYDNELFLKTVENIRTRYQLPEGFTHNLVSDDFFNYDVADASKFTHIIGNPPFGGTFEQSHIDALDKRYGQWSGYKIKKETYAFFISKCLRMLDEGSTLSFILSDTFLTIKTMEGLRRYLTASGQVEVIKTHFFSDETSWDMVTLHATATKEPSTTIVLDGQERNLVELEKVKGFSWGVTDDLLKYFQSGTLLSEYLLASSGMTIGKNEYFVRALVDGGLEEPYEFKYVDRKVTLEEELQKARLGKLSPAKIESITKAEIEGSTYRDIEVLPREIPVRVKVDDYTVYRPYNKADTKERYFTQVKNVVLWENDGEGVLLYKKNGPWYLHGVGGAKFFKKEGLTWPLISSSIKAKFLPEGFILDSGAPVAVLRPGVAQEELSFILGWLWTSEATAILKTVINHTRNIQGKDVERLPYPSWVSAERKNAAVTLVQRMLKFAAEGNISEADLLLTELLPLYVLPANN